MVHCSVIPRANHVAEYEGHGSSDMNHIAATKPYYGTRNFVLDATVSCSGTNFGAIAGQINTPATHLLSLQLAILVHLHL